MLKRLSLRINRDASTRTVQRARQPRIEGLESRCLLALTINEFPVPTADSFPNGITAGPDGEIWFTEQAANKIGRINPTTHAFAEFPNPTSGGQPNRITAGPDHNLWFTSENGNALGQLNPATHAFAQFPVPTANPQFRGITTGPDGNIWFTESVGNKIGQINPTTHVITEFAVPTAGAGPYGITTGPDGNLWFAEASSGMIGRINPATHAFAEFSGLTAGSSPLNITTGSDGNLWFTEGMADKIGRINPTSGAVTEFPTPTAHSEPTDIVAGPDGNVWFTEANASKIGQINPVTLTISEFPVPTAGSFPAYITVGSDGNLWFTETQDKIGEVVLTTATTTQVTAAPNPSTVGQAVTFTATVSAQSGSAAPAGSVTFSIDGVAQPPVNLTAVGGMGQATLATSALTVGAHTITAAYNGASGFDSSQSAPVTQTVTAAVGGPQVVSVQRFGYHEFPTTIVLTFDEPLSTTPAQNLANYHLTTSNHAALSLKSAVYDSATQTVTLHPRSRLPLKFQYVLTVTGAPPGGLTNTAGVLLAGAGTPGTDFVTTITRQNLVITPHGVPGLGHRAAEHNSRGRFHVSWKPSHLGVVEQLERTRG